MPSFFKAIFGRKTDPRIAAWQAACAANKQDLATAGHWMVEIGKVETEVIALLVAYARDPENRELGEKVLALGSRIEIEKPLRSRLAECSVHHYHFRMRSRALEAGAAALDAAIEGLTEELAGIKKRDAEHGRKYGLDTTAQLSPLAQQAQEALDRAQGYKQSIQACTQAHQIEGLVNEILNTGKMKTNIEQLEARLAALERRPRVSEARVHEMVQAGIQQILKSEAGTEPIKAAARTSAQRICHNALSAIGGTTPPES